MTELEALRRNRYDKTSRSLTAQINAHELPEVFAHVEQAFNFGSEENDDALDARWIEEASYRHALDAAYASYDRRSDRRTFAFDRQEDHPARLDPRAQ